MPAPSASELRSHSLSKHVLSQYHSSFLICNVDVVNSSPKEDSLTTFSTSVLTNFISLNSRLIVCILVWIMLIIPCVTASSAEHRSFLHSHARINDFLNDWPNDWTQPAEMPTLQAGIPPPPPPRRMSLNGRFIPPPPPPPAPPAPPIPPPNPAKLGMNRDGPEGGKFIGH
jgi:hypothetical protein